MEKLSRVGFEESDYPVTLKFWDRNKDPMTPDSIKWRLTTMTGVVVNGRDYVTITPATTVKVPIGGDDAAPLESELNDRTIERMLTLICLYTSDLGSGRHLNKSVVIEFETSVGIPNDVFLEVSDAVAVAEDASVSLS